MWIQRYKKGTKLDDDIFSFQICVWRFCFWPHIRPKNSGIVHTFSIRLCRLQRLLCPWGWTSYANEVYCFVKIYTCNWQKVPLWALRSACILPCSQATSQLNASFWVTSYKKNVQGVRNLIVQLILQLVGISAFFYSSFNRSQASGRNLPTFSKDTGMYFEALLIAPFSLSNAFSFHICIWLSLFVWRQQTTFTFWMAVLLRCRLRCGPDVTKAVYMRLTAHNQSPP